VVYGGRLEQVDFTVSGKAGGQLKEVHAAPWEQAHGKELGLLAVRGRLAYQGQNTRAASLKLTGLRDEARAADDRQSCSGQAQHACPMLARYTCGHSDPLTDQR
jgi:hypothetical protein